VGGGGGEGLRKAPDGVRMDGWGHPRYGKLHPAVRSTCIIVTHVHPLICACRKMIPGMKQREVTPTILM